MAPTRPAQRIRGGVRIVDDGVDQEATRDCHIERHGSSHPLSCFNAWLADPLGLADLTLEHLPQPPRIASGPLRRMRADSTSTTLRFCAVDALGLLGAWVSVSGRPPRFLRAGEAEPSRGPVGDNEAPERSADDAEPHGPTSAEFSVTLDGRGPLDVELVAVGRTGLESKPWRVRIEGAE